MLNTEISLLIGSFTELTRRILVQYNKLIKIEEDYKNHPEITLDYRKDPKYNEELIILKNLIQEERLFWATLEDDIDVLKEILDRLKKTYHSPGNILALTNSTPRTLISQRMMVILEDLIITHRIKESKYAQEAYATKSAIKNAISKSIEQELIDSSTTPDANFYQFALRYKYLFLFITPQIEKMPIENKFRASVSDAGQSLINGYQNEYELLAYDMLNEYIELFNRLNDNGPENILQMIIRTLKAIIRYLPTDKKEEMRSYIMNELAIENNDLAQQILNDSLLNENNANILRGV